MKLIEELRAAIAALYTERQSLIEELDTLGSDDESRSADEITTRADEITARAKAIGTELADSEARLTELVDLQEKRDAAPKGVNFIRTPDAPRTEADIRSMTIGQMSDVMERSFDANDIDGTDAMRTIKRHRGDREWIDRKSVV